MYGQQYPCVHWSEWRQLPQSSIDFLGVQSDETVKEFIRFLVPDDQNTIKVKEYLI